MGKRRRTGIRLKTALRDQGKTSGGMSGNKGTPGMTQGMRRTLENRVIIVEPREGRRGGGTLEDRKSRKAKATYWNRGMSWNKGNVRKQAERARNGAECPGPGRTVWIRGYFREQGEHTRTGRTSGKREGTSWIRVSVRSQGKRPETGAAYQKCGGMSWNRKNVLDQGELPRTRGTYENRGNVREQSKRSGTKKNVREQGERPGKGRGHPGSG